MPRGRPKKNSVIEATSPKMETEAPVSASTSSATSTQSPRGRKPQLKELPRCECCGKEITTAEPYRAKFNQILCTGSYNFEASNISPNMCKSCWKDLLHTVDNWFLTHGISAKFRGVVTPQETMQGSRSQAPVIDDAVPEDFDF